eukprot:2264022-Pyramimonas_sp.AAC.1
MSAGLPDVPWLPAAIILLWSNADLWSVRVRCCCEGWSSYVARVGRWLECGGGSVGLLLCW